MPQAIPYPSTIPKKIHFIWVGKHIPEKYLRNISTFSIRNLDYEIHLWSTEVDRFTRSMIRSGMRVTSWRLRTIDQLNLDPNYRAWINWEMTGPPFANFAAASDMLRLAILFHEGGIYTDTDNLCLRSFGTLQARYGFLVTMGGLDKNTLSNALMASARGNSYINEMGLYILDKYQNASEEARQAKRIPGTKQRRDATIEMTGPGAISRAIEGYGHQEDRQIERTVTRTAADGRRERVTERRTVQRYVHDLLYGGFAPHPDVRFPPNLVYVASDKNWLGSRPRAAESPI